MSQFRGDRSIFNLNFIYLNPYRMDNTKKVPKKIAVYRSRVRQAARSNLAGQGFQSQSFAGEQRSVLKGWEKTCECSLLPFMQSS